MAPESIEERLAAIEVSLQHLQLTVDEIKHALNHYVTHTEFRPIRNGFYGLCAAMGLAFMAALNKLLFK